MLLCSGSVFSQTGVAVKGKVRDDKDSAIANVSIVVKGTTTGTTTDEGGNFSITVPNPKATLVFTGVGYKSTELALADQTEVNVRLNTLSNDLENVIVVGYGTQRKLQLPAPLQRSRARSCKNLLQ